MIEKGAKGIINSFNENGDTPINCCVRSDKYIEMVEMLISHGANVNATNVETGSSPLHIAVSGGKGSEQVLDLLLNSKANTDVVDNSKCSPLHDATMFGNDKIVKKLIDNGADVNAFISVGDNTLCSLHLSVIYKREAVLETLLKNGANINLADKNGMTALHMVAKEDGLSGDIGKILLDNSTIDTDKVDKYGKTARMYTGESF